ncbi:PA4780 family RIO1-like protein kinase [Leucothrix pacifica]|uniref:non-specific serine/threonine protein kinase n=1 Tax=Leucothrix pacifica TaxID=1247513 RepID=A0A317C118_9GAMM|nr:PA4780 family RIO1-like protein kinase [Leucothrix pacifica]PWQ92335.1 serine protein kinase RIO [Leucothrix pacifica]
MKIPKRLQPLVDDGLIDEVLSRLMSGKEADVYVVRSGDELRCAKVYKEAAKRSFKKAAQYTEGRKVRNSRRQRAMEKGSKFGRKEQEQIWQNAEVDALYQLADAGVRVPEPRGCMDGVLLMELVVDENGDVAPRLGDVMMTDLEAIGHHAFVMQDVVRMLCAGIVHGDLSEFNVLLDEYGPVIIDLPQAVNASANNNAKAMLERDVDNMTKYFGQFAPDLLETNFGKEIWQLFEDGKLRPDTVLTGEYEESEEAADVDGVMIQIQEAFKEEQERLERIRQANEGD